MAAGTDLKDRDATITVGTTRIACRDPLTKEARPALRFVFKVMGSIKPEPNKCTFTVYNLSREHRALLQTKNIPVTLEAGYIGNAHQIFSGVLEYGQSVQSGVDWVTTIQNGDGSDKIKSQRINVGLRGPAPLSGVLKQVAEAMGVGLGNLQQAIARGGIRGALTEFTKGIVLSGKAEEQLTKITKAAGYDWSIQGGQLALLGPTDTLGNGVISLQPGTGLVGSPEQGDQGYMKIRSLLQPDLLPGRRVQVASAQVNGAFRIEKVTFSGDTWGQDWYADLEAKPLR